MKYGAFLCLSMVLVAGVAMAQSGPVNPGSAPGSFAGAPRLSDLVETPSATGFRLLDPSRLKMSQSYSMSYFSGSGNSGSVGLYMNTLEYQFSRMLTVRVGLAYLHQPLGFLQNSGGRSELSEGRFLPNMSIDFRPSNKFRMLLDFRTVPTFGGYNGFSRYGYGPRTGMRNPWYW